MVVRKPSRIPLDRHTGLRQEVRQLKGIPKISLVGAALVLVLFVAGVALMVVLNSSKPDSSFRDIGLLFGAALAATGAITAAFIAFSAAQTVEEQKDLRERARKIDSERVIAESSVVALHAVATVLDQIFIKADEDARALVAAAKQRNAKHYRDACLTMSAVPMNLPVLDNLQIPYLKDREQAAVRSMQVALAMLSENVQRMRSRNESVADVLEEINRDEDSYWTIEGGKAEALLKSALYLFERITPYINRRDPSVAPDESKLILLLGGYASDVSPRIADLEEVSTYLSQIASDFLKQHVSPADLRRMFRATADKIKDEDVVPYRPA
jgi:hypothetical protein